MTKITVVQGDITQQQVDAIVNAANPSLLGGGGVDGAIHKAAGSQLVEECKALDGCKSGEAKITKGYKLPAHYVIHTVGPVYRKEGNEAGLLSMCYINSLKVAKNNGIKSIAFPAISTGVYGYPKDKAVKVVKESIVLFLKDDNEWFNEIRFVLYSPEQFNLYRKEFSEFLKS